MTLATQTLEHALVPQQEIKFDSANVRHLTRNFAKTNYALRISICGGFSSVTLKSDDFKNPEVAATLAANGVRSKDTLPVFEYLIPDGEEVEFEEVRPGTAISVTWARNQLAAMLQDLQKRYLYYVDDETGWLCSEDDLAAVNQGIRAMQAKRNRLHEILQHYRPLAEVVYLQRIENVLTAANKLSDLDMYIHKFPSAEMLDRKFAVRHSPPIRVPSLVEQLAGNAEALHALAEQTSAESGLQATLALQEMQQSGLAQLRAAQQEAATKLRDELYQLVADSLSEMEELGEQSCGIKMQTRLRQQADRIEAITNLLAGLEGSDLSNLSSTVDALRQGFSSSANSRELLQQRISEFRNRLRSEVRLDVEGTGHKSLAAWLML